jgi:hypothetical protein
MALSGSKDFAVTRSDIINAALRKLGEYDQAEAPSGDETAAASFALNAMIKEWVADGADLFLRDEITLFLQPGTTHYSLGGTANATKSFIETTLSSSASSGATTVSLASTTGMTAADNIGIKLDDDSIHWTTISDVSGTDIASGLSSAASSGNRVYTYTTTAGRPQKLIYAYRRDVNGIDAEVRIMGEREYQRLSDKDASGPPVELFYRQTISTGTLFVWPTDGGSTWDKLVLVVQELPDDLDLSSNNPFFPIEWANTLVWNLAAEMAPEYGIMGPELKGLWAIAQNKLSKLLDYDVEDASVVFGMDHER